MNEDLEVERRFGRVDIGILLPLLDAPHRLLDPARPARESEALDTPLTDDVRCALDARQGDGEGGGGGGISSASRGMRHTRQRLTSRPNSSKIPRPSPSPSARPNELPPDEGWADPDDDDAAAAARLAAIELPGTLLGPSLAVVETEMGV